MILIPVCEMHRPGFNYYLRYTKIKVLFERFCVCLERSSTVGRRPDIYIKTGVYSLPVFVFVFFCPGGATGERMRESRAAAVRCALGQGCTTPHKTTI